MCMDSKLFLLLPKSVMMSVTSWDVFFDFSHKVIDFEG